MSEEQIGTRRLRRGEVLHFHADRGTMIATRQGSIRILSAPLWIGEQLVQERFLLGEGQAHAVPHAGMLRIQAQSEAEIVCITSESRFLRRLSAWRAQLSARLRRSRLRQILSARTMPP
ncbi:MAG TPA: hypothetical protein VGE12_15820 [Noviherbaspirillum sp.]